MTAAWEALSRPHQLHDQRIDEGAGDDGSQTADYPKCRGTVQAGKRAESMDQESLWTADATGPPGKPASATHGFPCTPQNASNLDVREVC